MKCKVCAEFGVSVYGIPLHIGIGVLENMSYGCAV